MTEEEKIEKFSVSPDTCMWPDDEHENFHIEITLPGVEKDSIVLKMHDDSFFIKGETDNTVYIGSYSICCPVDAKKAKANYNNGLLKIDVPFKGEEYESVSVKIE